MKTLTKIGFLSMMMLCLVSCKKDKANAVIGDAKAVVGDAKVMTSDPAASSSYAVHPTASIVTWEGSKIAGTHTGTLSVSEGSISMDNGKVTGGNFTIDMMSLTCTDLEAGQGKEDLEGHLKAPDFFDVATYPTANFTITKVAQLAGDAEANSLVYGNLTIKGIEKEIAFKAMINDKGTGVTVTTPEFGINRTDFGVKYNSSSFMEVVKDKVIDDNIKLSIRLGAS